MDTYMTDERTSNVSRTARYKQNGHTDGGRQVEIMCEGGTGFITFTVKWQKKKKVYIFLAHQPNAGQGHLTHKMTHHSR
jgi:hypothetical protein